MSPTNPPASALPVVVQLGFAGSRNLFDPKAPPADPDAFDAAVTRQLAEMLKDLPKKLHLQPHHFLCGLSQIARGGDLAFTRACQIAQVAQRLFLPQPLKDYLAAPGSSGPDFTPAEQDAARKLVASPHLLHRRVVSQSEDRHARFQETNLELLRASDACLCLVTMAEGGGKGGTREFIEGARLRGLPTLVLCLEVRDGQPVLTEHKRFNWPEAPAPKSDTLWTWLLSFFRRLWSLICSLIRPSDDATPATSPRAWPPSLHPLLASVIRPSGVTTPATSPAPGVPISAAAFLNTLKASCSPEAGAERRRFRLTAAIVVATHLVATLAAVLVLKLPEAWRIPLLLLELVLLATGIGRHWWHHHSRAAMRGAVCRVGAEVARSCLPLKALYTQLEHLFLAPYPEEFRPLLRTVNVLHLASSRSQHADKEEEEEVWKGPAPAAPVADYLNHRLDGQCSYYRKAHNDAWWSLLAFKSAFYILAGGALAGALVKLVAHPAGAVEVMLGAAGILLPVMAVAAISTAVAFDWEPREHTFHETLGFLERMRPVLEATRSEAEFIRLVLETETRLLSENATWASRRSFANPP